MKNVRLWLTVLGFMAAPAAQAQQISIDRNMWDFGSVNFWKNDTARFQIRNAGMKPLVFLPVFYNEDYRVTFSSKSLEPGETGTVSIIYYARVKGPFSREVPVYVNLRNEPITFQLKGWIKGFNPDAQLRCPTVVVNCCHRSWHGLQRRHRSNKSMSLGAAALDVR